MMNFWYQALRIKIKKDIFAKSKNISHSSRKLRAKLRKYYGREERRKYQINCIAVFYLLQLGERVDE